MTDINCLRKEHDLIDIFCTLAEIPSPSGKEDKVADKIVEILTTNGVNAYKDARRFISREHQNFRGWKIY